MESAATTPRPQKISIRIGNILYKHFFPVYNRIYPVFKRRQDAAEIDFLRKTVRNGDTILDIGANIGFYSKILADLAGKTGKVYCFEPDAINYKHLVANIRGCETISSHQLAVSQNSGELKLYTSKMLNVDHRTYQINEYDEVIRIPCVSIDDFVGGKFKVDFIKMDIQGYEYYALMGMEKTLEQNRSIQLIMELWPYGLQLSNTSFKDYLDFFDKHGLELFRMHGSDLVRFEKGELVDGKSYDEAYYFNVCVKRK